MEGCVTAGGNHTTGARRPPRVAPPLVRRFVASLCLGLLGLLTAGCRAPEPATPDGPPAARRVIYESQGTITALQTVGSGCGDRAFVADCMSDDSLRFVVLDVASGEATVVYESAYGLIWNSLLAIAPDGRPAIAIEGSADHHNLTSRFAIGDLMPALKLRYALTPEDERFRDRPQWSPTGDALAYWRRTGWIESYEGVVAWVPPRDSQDAETVVVPDAGLRDELIWSADGRRLYYVRRVGEQTTLHTISWPSLETRELVAAEMIEPCGVARQTGDFVFLMSAERTSDTEATELHGYAAAWRLSNDGVLTRTPALLPDWPLEATVSPDGERLAVVAEAREDSDTEPSVASQPDRFPRSGGLFVLSLQDGTSQHIAGFDPDAIRYLSWVLGERALLFAEDAKRVWVIWEPALKEGV